MGKPKFKIGDTVKVSPRGINRFKRTRITINTEGTIINTEYVPTRQHTHYFVLFNGFENNIPMWSYEMVRKN